MTLKIITSGTCGEPTGKLPTLFVDMFTMIKSKYVHLKVVNITDGTWVATTIGLTLR